VGVASGVIDARNTGATLPVFVVSGGRAVEATPAR
jgi:hypothetical protein